MLPEGMVHALELLHGLVKPGGRLVDIHPTGEPPVVTARLAGGDEVPVGNLLEIDDFIEYRQAEAALAQAVANGWYSVEQQSIFLFRVHTAGIEELSAYLKEDWLDAFLPEETYLRAQELQRGATPVKEIVLNERIRIARLSLEKI